MDCEIIDFDATTCALALDSGHITHVEVNYLIVQSPVAESMVYKDPMLEKVHHYHRLAFVSKQKFNRKVMFIAYPHIHVDTCVFIKYIFNIKEVC